MSNQPSRNALSVFLPSIRRCPVAELMALQNPTQSNRKAHLMNWKHVRLELARTSEFPDGSRDCAYELVVPLDAQGVIDRKAFEAARGRATVQRIWPHQATQRGAIIRRKAGWAFSYAPGDADDETVFHLEDHPLAVGNYVTVTETNGERLPFRVVRSL